MPFLLNISDVPKLIPTIISAMVAVAAVLANYYKFGQRSHNMFRTYRALEVELDHFDTGAGIYRNLNEEQAFELFVVQVDTVMSIDFEIITALEEGQQQLPEHLLTLSKDKIKDNQS